MEIEQGNTIENINTTENKNEIYKKTKRLYLSYIVTIVQFIAMILQIIKYGISGKAMVSGWSKVMQNLICGTTMIYLKCSSYDIEFNNKWHVTVFTLQRLILFGGLIFMIYTDSKNDFESFKF
ncbi:MAG: hypothetical protein CMF69_04615 [Magnetovibrio sp.]|nr:hypothetical protein [Magnetovibrio sp.]